MRSLTIYILLAILSSQLGFSLRAQELQLGLRDNDYTRLGIKTSSGLLCGAEMSLFSSAGRNQIGRLYAGIGHDFPGWSLNLAGSAATNLENRYQQYGLIATLRKDWKWVSIKTTFYPNYDTLLHWQWDGEVEASGHLLHDLDLCASWGNVPQYREDISYLRFGLQFHSDNLWVKPMVNLPRQSDQHLRIIVSMGWSLSLCK